MEISEIFEFLKEWKDLLGSITLVSITTALYNYYLKKRKGKRSFEREQWRLIKSTKQIKKKDFNVSSYNRLIKRPSENEIKKTILENKKNVLLIGGNKPNLKYGKSTLLYSILKKKELKDYILFIPNLSTQIISEDKISIPIRWLQTKKKKFIILVEDINNYKNSMGCLITYYKLLSKKASDLFIIITTNEEFDIDWGELELNLHKIKLSPIDKINENDSIQINKIYNDYNSLNPFTKKILSYLYLYEQTGLKSNKQFIFNVLSFEISNIEERIFSEKLLILQALDFINWIGEEIKLKKSKINPDISNYELIKSKKNINIDIIVNYFIYMKNSNGLIHCSKIYNNSKDFSNSKMVLKEIIKYKPNHHKAKFLLGQTYLDEYQSNVVDKKIYKINLLDTALSWYEKASVENENFYSYKLSLAYCLIKRAQSPKNSKLEKQDYFEKALLNIDKTKNSNNLDHYSFNYAYAFLYKRLKKLDISLEYYKKVIELNLSEFNYKLFTEYAELLLEINKSNFQLDYINEIKKHLLISIKIKPTGYYKTNYVLADFYNWRSRDPRNTEDSNKKYKELSLENYEAAFQKSNKKYLYALKGKAKVLISLNRNDEAIEIFERILSINPNDFYSLKSIGTAHKKNQNIDKAISYYLYSLDKCIDLGYIKTLNGVKQRKFPQLFKELSALSDNNSFIKLLESSKEKTKNLLTKEFIEFEIDYSKVKLIKKEIDKLTYYDLQIESDLKSITNPELKDFKNKTLALYYIKLGDIQQEKQNKLKLYNKAENLLLKTYTKRGKKPQSYYKHLIVISGKVSLLDGENNFENIIKKFEKQILYADLTYAEIHFEFAKYLEKLLKINYNYSNNLIECIKQYELAYKKFSLSKHNYKEIEYCEKRLMYLKSAPNSV